MSEENEEKESMELKGLRSRTLVISDQVNSKLASTILKQLTLLEQEAPEEEILIFINCPGGEVFSGFAIFDMLQFIECPVTTIVTGFAASMGSILSLAADKNRRFALPSAKIMIHQPLLTGYQGRATDMEIQAKEILKTRDFIIDIYCKATGKTYEEIKNAIDRDNWFSAEEALEFGLIDRIISSRKELKQ
ncbi:MAG: ATP-dependent Clp protease proteolytic subunit [SAR324 cluster bacterium]|nr:ATP-dependent Clp protease proteolytic subunit [SAR324 cluster bacterium]